MRPELNEIQIIEKFILGELSNENEQKVFEKIKNDPEFAKKVEKQRLIVEANKNLGLKQTAKKSKSKFKLKKLLKVGIPVVAALAVAGYLYTSNAMGGEDSSSSVNIKYEVNEMGESLWSEADVEIEPQFFTVNADQDNLLTGKDGTKIAIPKGALLNANGNPVTGSVEIELKEALKAEDIIKGGLSTMSGDNLLETGGMVYFNARKDGENLIIDPAKQIAIDVPTDEIKEGMMLYDGVRQEDGAIDWQNPKELNSDLITVDIHSLDFYPTGYEAEVERLGYKNKSKEWLDSLYYSFALIRMDTLINWKDYWIGEGVYWDNLQHVESKYPSGVLMRDWVYSQSEANWDIPFTWMMINGIDPAKIKAIWNDEFQDTYISTKEFEKRLKLIYQTCDDKVLDIYVSNLDKTLGEVDKMAAGYICAGGLTTVDSVGLTGGRLNTSQWASTVYATCPEFKKFAAQKLGGVKVSSEAVKMLNNYYKNVAAAQQQATKKVQAKFWSEYQEGVKEISDIDGQEVQRMADNYQKMYYEELNFNIKEVAAQLGIPADTEMPSGTRGYVASVGTPGWLNIDRQIRASLDSRTSVDVTLDGKNAKIAYQEMTVELTNESDFDRVLTYLLPKEMTSYQRVIKRDGAKFTETLNEFMKYDLLVVGFKGEDVSLAFEENISPKDYKLAVKPSSMDRLNALMSESGKGADARKDLTASIKNQIRQRVLTDKMEPYKKMQRFRNELAGTIFPCYDFPLYTDEGPK